MSVPVHSFLTVKVAVQQSIKSICGLVSPKVEILILKGSLTN